MAEMNIKVKTEVLSEKAEKLKASIDSVEKAVKEMETAVNKTSGFWVGEAGDHYRQRFSQLYKEAQIVFKRYRGQGTKLQTISGLYETVESTNESVGEGLPDQFLS